MINPNEDTQVINYISNIVMREDWVTEEILLIYEDCYRRLKKLAEELNLDTNIIDESRQKVMEIYGQI